MNGESEPRRQSTRRKIGISDKYFFLRVLCVSAVNFFDVGARAKR